MKVLSICATVLFLVYLPSSKALPGVSIEPHHHEPNNPLFQISGVERRDIRRLSLQSDTIELSLLKQIEHHHHMSGRDNEISINKFLKWLCNYFLIGKYRNYQSSPSIVQAPLNKPDDTEYHKKPVKREIAKNNHKEIVHKKKCKKTVKSGQKYTFGELVTQAENFGITYETLTTDSIPSEFPSQWLWNTICAIHAAVKKAQDSNLYFLSFEEVLDRHDAGLRIVAKPILQLIFSSEHDQLVKPRIRNMVSLWLDKIVFVNPYLDWRKWLLSSSEEPDSNDQYVNDLKPKYNETSTLNHFGQTELDPSKRPQEYFSSIILWDISVEIDNSIESSSPFSWSDDLILTKALPHILYLFARGDSLLSADESYLMGYWLDKAFQKISEQDAEIRPDEELDWREPVENIPVDVNLLYLTTKTPESASVSLRDAAVKAQKEITKIQKSILDW